MISVLMILGSTSASAFDHGHQAWTSWLAAHVQDGWVDYGKAYRDPKEIHAYLKSLQSVTPTEYESWSEK